MKRSNVCVVILMATLLSSPVFAAAPVTDVTASNSSNMQIDKRLQELTRLLENRNKMQVRLQSQLDELAQEMNQVKGSIELFNHKVEQIENRQREIYQMIDELNKPVAKPVSGKEVAVAGDDKVAYQQAVDLVLVNKEYGQAITAFEAFLIDYPQSSYIANSHYWLGQLLLQKKQFNEARSAFLTVVEKYPDAIKRPDSLYKIGFVDEYLGNLTSAQSFYNKVLKEFPDSSAAGLAKKRLAAF
jgi:tol-pal system protein YbgF